MIAISSGEAEYYGLVKAAAQAMGIKSMLEDFVIEEAIKIQVKTDSSTAVSIATRKGFGKVRHIEGSQLWLQEKVSSQTIKIVKVPGANNAADHLTKPGFTQAVKQHLEMTNQRLAEGRHSLMPHVAEDSCESSGAAEVADNSYESVLNGLCNKKKE